MEKTAIEVKDGNKYFYTTSTFNALNPLGVIKATLKEYSIFKMSEEEILIGKLYKTTEGNWYGLPGSNTINSLLATFIKMAIDETERVNKSVDETLY